MDTIIKVPSADGQRSMRIDSTTIMTLSGWISHDYLIETCVARAACSKPNIKVSFLTARKAIGNSVTDRVLIDGSDTRDLEQALRLPAEALAMLEAE